jgi:hypothetical protein
MTARCHVHLMYIHHYMYIIYKLYTSCTVHVHDPHMTGLGRILYISCTCHVHYLFGGQFAPDLAKSWLRSGAYDLYMI